MDHLQVRATHERPQRLVLRRDKQLQMVLKCVMQAQPLTPNHLHYVTPSAGRRARTEIPLVHVISSAVAAPPLKGKVTARNAMAVGAAYARMAHRGTGALNAVGKPDVLMAYSAASAHIAEDQAYARMGK